MACSTFRIVSDIRKTAKSMAFYTMTFGMLKRRVSSILLNTKDIIYGVCPIVCYSV